MNASLSLALILAIVWGIVWAVALQFTSWGRWLAVRRTWITVVVGVAGVGLIALLVVDIGAWLQLVAIMAASSLGVIIRSLINEFREEA
jgi:hypothetical protein